MNKMIKLLLAFFLMLFFSIPAAHSCIETGLGPGRLPMMSQSQIDVLNPSLGHIVYNTNDNDIQVYNGSSWAVFGGALGSLKSYTVTTGSTTGIFHAAGNYTAPSSDTNLDDGSPTVNHGDANEASGGHAFLVASGAGSASGGTGAVSVVVSGTSVTDAGTRITTDSQVIVPDITAMSANEYFETPKKWIGQQTFTLTCSGGCTHTTYSADFNYGYVKYEDLGNQNFIITDFECTGLAGATDSGFDLSLNKHSNTGWNYSPDAFKSGDGEIVNITDFYTTENNLVNGNNFAFKRTGLSVMINGADSEGFVIEFTTTAANAIRYMNCSVGGLMQ